MPKRHLTDRLIRSLKTDTDTEYWDDVVDKLVLRVLPSGTKTWLVRYYTPMPGRRRGKYRRTKIGNFPDMSLARARNEARVLIGRERDGEDPGGWREREKARWTFSDLADEYVRRHAKPKKASWREDKRILTKDLLPAFAGLPADSIKKRDAVALLDQIVDRGSPVMANRTRALLSRIYTFGLGRDIVEHNPVLGTERPGREGRRDRVLRTSEIRVLWKGLHAEEPSISAGLRLLLLTGQRSGSVRRMEFSHIEGSWWTIPRHLFKSRRPHRVYLSSLASGTLTSLPSASGPLVLPSPRGEGELARTAFAHAARRIYPRLGLSQFTPHDLRRTVASHMAELGVQRFVIERVLGHVDSSVTGRYDHYEYDKEKREALESWGRRLSEIVLAATPSPEHQGGH